MGGWLLCPKEQPATNNQARDEQVDDAEAHNVFGIQLGNGQSRQSPERLDQIGPSITPRDGHTRQARSHTQSGTCREHHRCLDGPVTATRRHEHIQYGRTEEGEQRIGLGR